MLIWHVSSNNSQRKQLAEFCDLGPVCLVCGKLTLRRVADLRRRMGRSFGDCAGGFEASEPLTWFWYFGICESFDLRRLVVEGFESLSVSKHCKQVFFLLPAARPTYL